MPFDFSHTDPATFLEENRKQAPGHRFCAFCRNDISHIDWKDYPTIKKYVDYFGNMKKRAYTGTCLKHQKKLKRAIEHARFMALLPYRN